MMDTTDMIDECGGDTVGGEESGDDGSGVALRAFPEMHLTGDDICEDKIGGSADAARFVSEWEGGVEGVLEQPLHGKVYMAGLDLKESVIAAIINVRDAHNAIMISVHVDALVQIRLVDKTKRLQLGGICDLCQDIMRWMEDHVAREVRCQIAHILKQASECVLLLPIHLEIDVAMEIGTALRALDLMEEQRQIPPRDERDGLVRPIGIGESHHVLFESSRPECRRQNISWMHL